MEDCFRENAVASWVELFGTRKAAGMAGKHPNDFKLQFRRHESLQLLITPSHNTTQYTNFMSVVKLNLIEQL